MANVTTTQFDRAEICEGTGERLFHVGEYAAPGEHVKKETGEMAQENARLRLALREAHHRSGNQWQLLIGLAELERMQPLQTVAAEQNVRLHAMIHAFATLNRSLNTDADVLTESREVGVRAALEGILIQMRGTLAQENTLSFTLQEAWLPAKGCAALLLSCAELVCNAIKHGRERMQVTFRAQGEQGLLEVRDDGPGFPAGFRIEEQSGQGLQLVEALCRFDLNGNMCCYSEAQGAVITLTFPVLSAPQTAQAGETNEAFCDMEGVVCF